MSAVEVLVIGSGAGGAITARELARRGRDVMVLEEGPRVPIDAYGGEPSRAMALLYRDRGMTPILGRTPIGFVEGCCLGGSTEINSGFWQRTSSAALERWRTGWDLEDAEPARMQPLFEELEDLLGVTSLGRDHWPASTRKLADGAEALGWSVEESPRAAPGCRQTNTCAQGCPTGAKQGMSRRLLPEAEAAGAKLLTGVRAIQLVRRKRRVTGVVAMARRPDGRREVVRIDAEHVFVCGGPTQTPALLRRSGAKYHVGDTLNIHPMLKVAALFPERIGAERSVLPLLQVREFGPEVSMGGAYLTRGHLAMHLSDDWREQQGAMRALDRIAAYYVAVRGTGRGAVRAARFGRGARLAYRLTRGERVALSRGLARLSTLLLAAGAEAVHPGAQRMPPIRSEAEAARWLDRVLSADAITLTTVHAFSSCPAGERRERCAVDSHGRVFDFENLFVNDASILPDSPGVNPQGSVMAFALRNARHFCDVQR